MKVKRTEIKKLFWETAICEECDTEMVGTGNYLASFPPEYELICPKCGKTEFVSEKFPRMNFELVEEAEEV